MFKANGGKNMAKRTFTDTMTIGSGADRIDLYYFGRGHTNGDAWTVFPALRVMHAGDIFSGKLVPLLDSNNGGSGVEIADTLAKAATLKDVDQIITGHSTVMTPADLKEYAEFNRDFLAYVREAKKAGKSVDEAASGYKIPGEVRGVSGAAAGQRQEQRRGHLRRTEIAERFAARYASSGSLDLAGRRSRRRRSPP